MHCFRSTIDDTEESFNLKIENWFSPILEETYDYKRYAGQFLKKIKQMTYEVMDLIGIDDNYIINLDMRSSGIKFGKASYMSCDIMLFRKKENIDSELYLLMLNDLLKKDTKFKFYKSKKDMA